MCEFLSTKSPKEIAAWFDANPKVLDILDDKKSAGDMRVILASRAWTEPQRKWLERIGKQLEQETIVDLDALDAGQFKEIGGFSRLNKVFKGELQSILREIADAMWAAA